MSDVNQSEDMGSIFSAKVNIADGNLFEIDYIRKEGTLANAIINGYGDINSIVELSDYSNVVSGLYKTEDDYGTSYYFRGNPDNNYVKFGTLSNEIRGYYDTTNTTAFKVYNSLEECNSATSYNKNCSDVVGTPLYWKIMRINGDGTIRLIYDGTFKDVEDSAAAFIGTTYFNGNNASGSGQDATFIGYMYGTLEEPYNNINSSNSKIIIDSWYQKHLKKDYEKFIADSIFCNDRSVGSETGDDTYVNISFGANYRINNNNPSLKCPNTDNNRDRFTVDDDELGNGALTYPIALITSDEFNLSGAEYGNTENFLYNNCSWDWTMSPNNAEILTGYSSSYYMYGIDCGSLDTGNLGSYRIRPVINLKANVNFTIDEDGTYVITTN